MLDNRYPDGAGAAGPQPYPASGDGYVIANDGKGNFGIAQASGGTGAIISFSLATAADTGSSAGLLMNNLNGTTPSAAVDSGEAGTANILPLDPTLWHEFWITIQADTTGKGSHKVDIYLDGSLRPRTFFVTAGTGLEYSGAFSYIALGMGNTGQSGAFDVDYFTYKIGAVAPTGSAVPVFTAATRSDGQAFAVCVFGARHRGRRGTVEERRQARLGAPKVPVWIADV